MFLRCLSGTNGLSSHATRPDGPVQTETERHPHPIAEAIRWQIREGEVIQAIGRARGANRTAADPVEVLVMTDVVLPFDVEPMEAADLDPRPTELLWPMPPMLRRAFRIYGQVLRRRRKPSNGGGTGQTLKKSFYPGNVPLLPRPSVTSSLAPAKSPALHGATSPACLIRRLGLLADLDRLPRRWRFGRDAAIPLPGGRVYPDKPDCAHAGVIVSSTHPRATTENRLTIARLILNHLTDFSMIVWGKDADAMLAVVFGRKEALPSALGAPLASKKP
jgi:hypothetical protein